MENEASSQYNLEFPEIEQRVKREKRDKVVQGNGDGCAKTLKNKDKHQEPFRGKSFAIIWRYRPTPESSDGAGDSAFAAGTGVLATVVLMLPVCDVFLDLCALLIFGAGRVLVFHPGRVTVAL